MLKDNYTEIRQWTIRYKDTNAQQQHQTDKDALSSLKTPNNLQTTPNTTNNESENLPKDNNNQNAGSNNVSSSPNIPKILKDDISKQLNIQICPLKFRAKFFNQQKENS